MPTPTPTPPDFERLVSIHQSIADQHDQSHRQLVRAWSSSGFGPQIGEILSVLKRVAWDGLVQDAPMIANIARVATIIGVDRMNELLAEVALETLAEANDANES